MVTSLAHFKQIHMSLREKSCRLADAYTNNRILLRLPIPCYIRPNLFNSLVFTVGLSFTVLMRRSMNSGSDISPR